MALAAFAGAVVVVNLASPKSMLSALLRRDEEALAEGTFRVGGLKSNPQLTWDHLYDTLRPEVGRLPSVGSRVNLGSLLESINLHEQDASKFSQQSPTSQGEDPDNLCTRLSRAMDRCWRRFASNSPPAGAIERFDFLKPIIQAPPPCPRATLYSTEFLEAWRGVLGRFLARKDVVESYARDLNHFEVTEQYRALILIQRELDGLSKSLAEAGKVAESTTCAGWLHRLLMGLIETEADTPTRLLSAELLARSATTRPAVEPLREFRARYHAAAADSPNTSISLKSRPTPAPAAYRSALRSLAWCYGLICAVLGALAAALLSTLASPFSRSGVESAAQLERKWAARIFDAAVPLGPILIVIVVIVRHVERYGVFSPAWDLTVSASAATAGVAAAAIWSGFVDARALSRAGLAAMLLLAPVGLASMAPSDLMLLLRPLDLAVGLPYIVVPGAVIVGFLALVLSPAPMRTIARRTAVTAALLGCLALGALVMHRSADRKYQDAVEVAVKDEFAARLGADWRDKYLKPAKTALGLP